MVNITMLQGRLVRDPEMRTTNSGKSVTSFTLAADAGDEKTIFIDCVAWEKTAEFVCKFFRKGSPIIVEGSLQQRSYEDKNGAKRTVTDIRVGKVHFSGGKSESGDQKPADNAPSAFSEYDGELPF